MVKTTLISPRGLTLQTTPYNYGLTNPQKGIWSYTMPNMINPQKGDLVLYNDRHDQSTKGDLIYIKITQL
jgi:hypothetical protein